MDSTSYFFLEDISIGTIESKTMVPTTPGTQRTNEHKEHIEPTLDLANGNQNKNITLYIVVKGHTPEESTNSGLSIIKSKQYEINPNILANLTPVIVPVEPIKSETMTTTTTSTSTTTPTPTTTTKTLTIDSKPIEPNVTPSPKGNNSWKISRAKPIYKLTPPGPDITAIVVLAIVVVLCCAILFTLVYHKLREGQGRGGRGWRDY